MSLHHFMCNGKERSVSINKTPGRVNLRFIDPEIIEQGLEKICFFEGQSVESFINNYHDSKRKVVSDIILSVKERFDFTALL